jgi:diadenosine tetraphosphate (Ap4A) HIT family hydrolase
LTCLFCNLARPDYRPVGPEDTVLLRGETVYAKPGLGALIQGYSLIIPLRHVGSAADLPPEELAEVCRIFSALERKLEDLYGSKLLAFEHGRPKLALGRAGCIDHVHIHAMPCSSVLAEALRLALEVTSTPLSSLSDLKGLSSSRRQYLAYLLPGETWRVTILDDPIPGQYVRRLLATALGRPDEWDWAVFPYRNRIETFIDRFRDRGSTWVQHSIQP